MRDLGGVAPLPSLCRFVMCREPADLTQPSGQWVICCRRMRADVAEAQSWKEKLCWRSKLNEFRLFGILSWRTRLLVYRRSHGRLHVPLSGSQTTQ
jgi:hypothetical protein